MIIEIKCRWTAKVLFTGDYPTIKAAVVVAISTDANLTGANLTGANLTGANLTRADLTDANLTGANLTRADLTDANLTGADLTGANLTGANLTRADLTSIRDDIWAVLSGAPREVAALRQALIEGRVDGSSYRGECACLVGTLANAAKIDIGDMKAITPNHNRPAERFFMGIKEGDTPQTCQTSKLALQWVDEWLENMQAAFAK